MEKTNPPVKQRRRQHPWATWADGEQRRAVRGTDFDTGPQAFATAGASWAARNGYTWTATTDRNSVIFTLTPEDGR